MSAVRSAALRGFRAAVDELGGGAERLAEGVGFPVEVLDTDDRLISVDALVALLEYAAVELQRPDLRLRVAARQDIGTLALAVRASATAGEALDCVRRFLFVHSRTVTLTAVPDPYHMKGVVALR